MSIAARAEWLVVVAVGCGGSVFTEGDGGAGTDSGKPASDSGASPVCPASPPTPNSACSPNTLVCEYGADPNPNCNMRMNCEGSAWVDTSSTFSCPGPGPTCPATYTTVPMNQDCTANNLMCSYPEGICICTRNFGGLRRMTPGWDCFPTKVGCPSPRPALGTVCSQPGLDCNYGACSGGVDEVCKGGYWQSQATACPG